MEHSNGEEKHLFVCSNGVSILSSLELRTCKSANERHFKVRRPNLKLMHKFTTLILAFHRKSEK